MTTTPELVQLSRRFPIGVELKGSAGGHFRVWAAGRQAATLAIENDAGDGDPRSRSRLRGRWLLLRACRRRSRPALSTAIDLITVPSRFPDPASRAQPFGPHGPSQVVDPDAFEWTDHSWAGLHLEGQVLYELHVGTFTREGTWRAAMDHLPALAEIGITAIEMMPVAEFPGRFGWGYDGVDLFAPSHLYGTPDDLRRFVDRAHHLGSA